MEGFRFLYWDDYETPEGNKGTKSDGSTDPSQDDPKGSRGGKDSV